LNLDRKFRRSAGTSAKCNETTGADKWTLRNSNLPAASEAPAVRRLGREEKLQLPLQGQEGGHWPFKEIRTRGGGGFQPGEHWRRQQWAAVTKRQKYCWREALAHRQSHSVVKLLSVLSDIMGLFRGLRERNKNSLRDNALAVWTQRAYGSWQERVQVRLVPQNDVWDGVGCPHGP
jgi:hypothetical protein